MPVLANARHEKFAQGIAAGLTADASYAAAGFKADRGNAVRMTAKYSVRGRLAELQRRAEAKFEMDRSEWLKRLKENADNCKAANDRTAERQALREIGLAMGGWYSAERTEMEVTAKMPNPSAEKMLENPVTFEMLARILMKTPENRAKLREILDAAA